MKPLAGIVLTLFLLLAAGAAAQGPGEAGSDPCRRTGEDVEEPGAGGDAPGRERTDGQRADGQGADGQGPEGPSDRSNGTQERPHDENGTRAGSPEPSRAPSRAPADPEACEREQMERDGLAAAYCRQHPDDARCEDLRERLERFCEFRPHARACTPPVGADHVGAFQACMRATPDNATAAGRHEDTCCTTFSGNPAVQRLCALRDVLAGSQDGRHVSFEAMADGLGFTNHTVGDRLVLDRLRYVPDVEDPDVSAARVGQRVEMRIGDEGVITVLDNPTGLVIGRGTGSFELRLPENATLEALEEGWRVRGDGFQAILLAHGLLQSGQDLTADGFISYHVQPAAPVGRSSSLGGETLERAAAKGHLGAEVSLRRDDPRGPVDVLQYDDVQVEVELPEQAATADNPIRVEFSAELEEGRTIVLDLDPELLGSTAPHRLDLHYYDVTYENGTRHALEVPFASAASLDDVMDPTDDDGQAEYWVVSDANGMHVLVSVPHWSIHAVTLASIAEVIQEPSVAAGIVAGAAGAVIAAVLLLRPRREDEE